MRILLVLSITLNLCFLAVIGWKLSERSDPSRASPHIESIFGEEGGNDEHNFTAGVQREGVSDEQAKVGWIGYDADNASLGAYIQQLQEAGFPASVIRGIVSSIVNRRYEEKIAAIQYPDDVPFWVRRDRAMEAERSLQMMDFRMEINNEIRDLLADLPRERSAAEIRQLLWRYGTANTEEIAALNAMHNQMRRFQLQLAADRVEPDEAMEMYREFRREQLALHEQVLSEESYREYVLRRSGAANTVQSQLSQLSQPEAIDREIYEALVDAEYEWNRRFQYASQENPSASLVGQLERVEMRRQQREILGDDHFLEFLTRGADSDLPEVTYPAADHQLSSTQILNAWETVRETKLEMLLVAYDPSLSREQRAQELDLLQEAAASTLSRIGGADYFQSLVESPRSFWLGSIRSVGLRRSEEYLRSLETP